MRLLRISTIIALAAVLATAVSAQPSRMGHGPHRGSDGPGGPPDPVLGAAGRALHDLDLSFDQRQQLREVIHDQLEGQLGTLARSFLEARHALEVQIWDPAATPDEIRSAADLVAQRARTLDEARHGLAVDVLGLLTDEQREAFHEMLAEGPMHPPGAPHRH